MIFPHWFPLSARLAKPLIVGVLLLLAGSATGQGVGDTDGDGLSDVIEIGLGTDPLNPDTDGDGADDGYEVANGTDPLVPPDLSVFSADISFVSKNGVTTLFNQAQVGDAVVMTMGVSNAVGADEASNVSGRIYIELGFDQIDLGTFLIPQIDPGETLPVTIVPNTLLQVPPLALADTGNGEPGFEWIVASPTPWLHVFMIEIDSSTPSDSSPFDNAAARSLLVGGFPPSGSQCDVEIIDPSADAPWSIGTPGGLVVGISDPAGVPLDPSGIEGMVAFFIRSDGSYAQSIAPLDFLSYPPLYLGGGRFGGAELVTVPASEAGRSIAIKPMAILPEGGSCAAELVIQMNSAPVVPLPALSGLGAALVLSFLLGVGLVGVAGYRRV